MNEQNSILAQLLKQQQQAVQPVQPVPQSSGSFPTFLIILIIALLGYGWYADNNDLWPFDQNQDDQGQIDDNDKDDKQDEDQQDDQKDDQQDERKDGIDFADATLVLVVDSETTVTQQDLVDAMRPLEGQGIWEKYGFAEYRKWDDEQPAAQPYLAKQPAPGVYVTRGGEVVKFAPLPDSVSKLEEVIKSWQK